MPFKKNFVNYLKVQNDKWGKNGTIMIIIRSLWIDIYIKN